MFTGLIETRGTVIENRCTSTANYLLIDAHFDPLNPGESIAIHGVCLTLLPSGDQQLAFDVSKETLQLTTLGELRSGDCVNIERAMLATARLGGHYVSGHIDTTATVQSIARIGDYLEVTIGAFAIAADMYLLPKGSITVDGVSLTINEVIDGTIRVMLVPHTLSVTTLGQLQEGQRLNIEFDYLTRIVAHQLRCMRGSLV
jgi:riboflavin synthase